MKTHFLKTPVMILVITAMYACSAIDINDDQAVLKDIQGTWVGYDQTGDMYTHIKLQISENTFNGWMLISDSVEEPSWKALPDEKGTFSLSSVQVNKVGQDKYRRLSFFILNRCCGDNSLTAKNLTKMITYVDGRGLSLSERGVAMARR